MGSAWVNGRLFDAGAPALLVTEPGFTVGDGVFTTTVVDAGVPFALDRNLGRLARHAAHIGLAELDLDRLRAGVREVVDADNVREGRLRVSVTDAVQVITVAPLTRFSPLSTSVTVPWRRNEKGALAGVKSLSFGEALVAQRWFRTLGADEGLLANTAGDVCEGVTSNVFVVIDGVLRTPPLSSGCLDGVTREIVCEVLGVDETPIPLEAMAEVSEAFWTSATRKVQPIGRHDGRELRVGDLTRWASETLASWVD